jgi:hypothetical protein
MFAKKHAVYFGVLMIPMLIVSTLLNIVYSLQVHDYIQINWLMVVLLAVAMSGLIAWLQTRKEGRKSPK